MREIGVGGFSHQTVNVKKRLRESDRSILYYPHPTWHYHLTFSQSV